jgi:hypothetical protein
LVAGGSLSILGEFPALTMVKLDKVRDTNRVNGGDIRAAKTRGTLKSALARVIGLPMPYWEAFDSAITEPT